MVAKIKKLENKCFYERLNSFVLNLFWTEIIFFILMEDEELVEGELDYSEDDFGKFKQEMENV